MLTPRNSALVDIPRASNIYIYIYIYIYIHTYIKVCIYSVLRIIYREAEELGLLKSICHESLCTRTTKPFGLDPNLCIHKGAVDDTSCAHLHHRLHIGAQLVEVLGWLAEDVLGDVLV